MKTSLKPKYITNDKGKKTSVILNIREYEDLLEQLEDLEDSNDLLKAEQEAVGFTPYETFREKFLQHAKS